MHGHALVIIGILELPIHQAAIRRSIQEQHGSDVTGLSAIHATGHIIRGCFQFLSSHQVRKNVCTQQKRLHSPCQKFLSCRSREEPSESVKTSTNGPAPRLDSTKSCSLFQLKWPGFCSALIVRRLVPLDVDNTRFPPLPVSCSPWTGAAVSSSTTRPTGTSPAPGPSDHGRACAARRARSCTRR